jgi:hypothetical protein
MNISEYINMAWIVMKTLLIHVQYHHIILNVMLVKSIFTIVQILKKIFASGQLHQKMPVAARQIYAINSIKY